MNLDARGSTISNPSDCPAIEISSFFWQQWQQHRETLYRCCIKWMGGNLTEAEDALSRAMLKAWEKVQKLAGKIENWKAWLTSLTHNLCVDIHREGRRGANRVEDIEGYASSEGQEWVESEDTPLGAVETGEKKMMIRRAVENLPTRLRETFILHFYEGLSYQEISQQQEISYDNVCKRISQARKILRKELRGYFLGEDETEPEQIASPTSVAMESATRPLGKFSSNPDSARDKTESLESSIGEKSQGGVEATPKKTFTSNKFDLGLKSEDSKNELGLNFFFINEEASYRSTQAKRIRLITYYLLLITSARSAVGEESPGERQPVQHAESESIVTATDGETSEEKLVVCWARNEGWLNVENLANPGFYEISIGRVQVHRRLDISRNPVFAQAVQGFKGDIWRGLLDIPRNSIGTQTGQSLKVHCRRGLFGINRKGWLPWGCRGFGVGVREKRLAPIFKLAKFGQNLNIRGGVWGNFPLTVQRMQQQDWVGKVAGDFLIPSRSPP